MPESPDFDQIARATISNAGEQAQVDGMFVESAEFEGRLVAAVAQRLRQVWNARGAADLNSMEAIIQKLGDTMDPDNARVFVDDAIRSLDS